MSPAQFIPLAEEIGLINEIGEWVLRTACAEAAKWPEQVSVAVNLSPVQFKVPSLPSTVRAILGETGLDAKRLELEITEGVFLSNDEHVHEMIDNLKKIGLKLALDDFGTGYSSLSYLLRVPFDKIKIDQSFVRGASDPESRNAALIRAMVGLASDLEMQTTAEGVETQEELLLVRNLGCSLIQGYYFGKPMPAEEARELASKGSATRPGRAFDPARTPHPHHPRRAPPLSWTGEGRAPEEHFERRRPGRMPRRSRGRHRDRAGLRRGRRDHRNDHVGEGHAVRRPVHARSSTSSSCSRSLRARCQKGRR